MIRYSTLLVLLPWDVNAESPELTKAITASAFSWVDKKSEA